jgi:hypothetical protein
LIKATIPYLYTTPVCPMAAQASVAPLRLVELKMAIHVDFHNSVFMNFSAIRPHRRSTLGLERA